MPPLELTEVLTRLRHDAEQDKEERRAHEEFEEVRAYFERVRNVCGELISTLDTRSERS